MSEPSLYDEVPYPGRAFAQTHPDRLATMATLFGIDAVAPGASRVLELGCGDGGNLLPMALALPDSSFVGIDLAPGAIERARSIAEQLGLQNITFEQFGFDDYEPDTGAFDYVIAHGVYSWVDAPLRDRLLALVQRALSERGVAYVSYNAQPGHRTRQALRDMLAFALEGIDEPGERMAAARALLTETTALWPGGEGLETTIGGQARMLLGQGDALFFHDTLSTINHALYFHEFAAHAGEHGLQFLAEAEYGEMQIGALSQELQNRLLATDDVVQREQLLDFLRQRMFRQTLLCGASVPLERPPRSERVWSLAAAGPIEWTQDEDSGRVTFTGTAGAQVTTDHPLLVDALKRIGAAWPGSVWIADLAGPDSESAQGKAFVCDAMLACFAASLLRLHAHPPQMSTRPGALPRATPLARLQARERAYMTTLRHTSIRLEDDLGWRLVTLLDGTRDRAALLAGLRSGNGSQTNLAGDLERSLDTLAKVSLLMPES